MSNSIVKHYNGRNYEWDGSVWAGQDDHMVPPLSVSANLDKLLTVAECANIGKVPPKGTDEELAAWRLADAAVTMYEKGTDEERAAWHREVAKNYRGTVPHCFCWNCGQFAPPPRPAYLCPNCSTVSFKNRKYCQFCGTKLESAASCSYCQRMGHP